MEQKKEKLTVLTGANGGLGLELARLFLKAGHRKIAFQFRRSEEKLQALLQEYQLPAEQHLYRADLTIEDEVASLRKRIEQNFGTTVGVLINLAGASTNAMSWKMSLEDFRAILDANLTSTFLCSREFIPGMRAEGTGRIINVSSVVAFLGTIGAAHYGAAKAGIVGLTKSLALELASKNITVNAIALGYFDRGLIDSVPEEMKNQIKQRIPAQRFGEPREIFECLQYLLAEGASYTTGQVLHLNGGLYF